jgi:alpha-beta hydrolase superfamily lysophospholipase
MNAALPGTDPAATRSIPGLNAAGARRVRALFRVLAAISPALAARVAAYAFTLPLARPLRPDDDAFLAGARTHRLRTPGGEVQVYEWDGAEPAVLVLHGWISHVARLQPVIDALRARGARVVAFDAPAHGRSAGRRADLHSFLEALVAVSRDCAPIGAIIAHSFGAITAATWLAENDAAPLRAAVLVGLPRDVGYLFDSFTITLGLSPPVVQRLRALFHARYGRNPDDYSAERVAARIRVPVLLVHGAQDELVPVAHSVRIARLLRDARLCVVPELNHSAPLRDPPTVALMADFLTTALRSSDEGRPRDL